MKKNLMLLLLPLAVGVSCTIPVRSAPWPFAPREESRRPYWQDEGR